MFSHHRKNSKNVIAGVAASSLLLLTACGNGDNGESNGGDEGEFGGTLTISGPSSYDFAVAAVAEQFMEEHPEVTVTTSGASTDQYQQNSRTQLASGTATDIV